MTVMLKDILTVAVSCKRITQKQYAIISKIIAIVYTHSTAKITYVM